MKINDKIIARKLQGETVLLNMENGDYFTLNTVGTEIYGHISKGKNIDEITGMLFEQYDVDKKDLEKDIRALIEKLKDKNIITG
jgi:hypothetical protein